MAIGGEGSPYLLMNSDLLGGLEHGWIMTFPSYWKHEFYDFPYILGIIIIPTDEFIFFRWVGIPPTSDQ